MKKKLPIIATLAGAAAVVGYRAVKGHGLFNRIRFKDVHSAVSKYIETNHPGSTYSAIVDTGEGYYTIITDGKEKYMLTITKTEDDVYIYQEEDLTYSF